MICRFGGMKRILNSGWVIVLATIALLGLGIIQLTWIWQAYELKQEQIENQLKELTPKIAVALEIDTSFYRPKIVRQEEPVPIDQVSWTVDSVMQAEGFDYPAYYAVLQKKENGFYESNTENYKEELMNSAFSTCLSCIVTIRYARDTLKPPTPNQVFIRSIEDATRLPGTRPKEEFVFLNLFIPDQALMTRRSMVGLFLLTLFFMGLLIGLFSFIQRSLAKQKKLSQVKDDFFNNMTHEFKTPLSSIRLAAKMLGQNPNEEKRGTYLNLIKNESKRLEGQVDKILQLSMIESNEVAFEKEAVDLNQIILEVVDRLKLLTELKKGTIQFDFQLEDSIVHGDEAHLSNAIYNLIENALKYSSDQPFILVSTFHESDRKKIIVKDKGIGIAAEHQAEIFDRFYRAQANDQYKGKGFGIGLSYVKAVVEAHNGSIHLNEKYQEGCEFIISLLPGFKKP